MENRKGPELEMRGNSLINPGLLEYKWVRFSSKKSEVNYMEKLIGKDPSLLATQSQNTDHSAVPMEQEKSSSEAKLGVPPSSGKDSSAKSDGGKRGISSEFADLESAIQSKLQMNTTGLSHLSQVAEDMENRLLKYGRLDTTSSFTKKTGKIHQVEEGPGNHEDFYDQSDTAFIDDSMLDDGNDEMVIYDQKYEDFFFYRGRLKEFTKSSYCSRRMKELSAIGKDEQKNKKMKGKGKKEVKVSNGNGGAQGASGKGRKSGVASGTGGETSQKKGEEGEDEKGKNNGSTKQGEAKKKEQRTQEKEAKSLGSGTNPGNGALKEGSQRKGSEGISDGKEKTKVVKEAKSQMNGEVNGNLKEKKSQKNEKKTIKDKGKSEGDKEQLIEIKEVLKASKAAETKSKGDEGGNSSKEREQRSFKENKKEAMDFLNAKDSNATPKASETLKSSEKPSSSSRIQREKSPFRDQASVTGKTKQFIANFHEGSSDPRQSTLNPTQNSHLNPQKPPQVFLKGNEGLPHSQCTGATSFRKGTEPTATLNHSNEPMAQMRIQLEKKQGMNSPLKPLKPQVAMEPRKQEELLEKANLNKKFKQFSSLGSSRSSSSLEDFELDLKPFTPQNSNGLQNDKEKEKETEAPKHKLLKIKENPEFSSSSSRETQKQVFNQITFSLNPTGKLKQNQLEHQNPSDQIHEEASSVYPLIGSGGLLLAKKSGEKLFLKLNVEKDSIPKQTPKGPNINFSFPFQTTSEESLSKPKEDQNKRRKGSKSRSKHRSSRESEERGNYRKKEERHKGRHGYNSHNSHKSQEHSRSRSFHRRNHNYRREEGKHDKDKWEIKKTDLICFRESKNDRASGNDGWKTPINDSWEETKENTGKEDFGRRGNNRREDGNSRNGSRDNQWNQYESNQDSSSRSGAQEQAETREDRIRGNSLRDRKFQYTERKKENGWGLEQKKQERSYDGKEKWRKKEREGHWGQEHEAMSGKRSEKLLGKRSSFKGSEMLNEETGSKMKKSPNENRGQGLQNSAWIIDLD